MVRHASLFSQLVALFHRQRFYELVYRHRAERYAKGFSCWDQFVAMLFCQLAQARSLREISSGSMSWSTDIAPNAMRDLCTTTSDVGLPLAFRGYN